MYPGASLETIDDALTRRPERNMKTPIAVALIVMGGLLVMTPPVSDYLYQRNVVALLSHPGIQSVNLDGKMDDLYRIGCWLTGSVMIGIAIFASLFSSSESAEHKSVAATQAA